MTTIDARTAAPGRRAEPAGITDIGTSTEDVLRSASGENFPVSPRVLPAAIREHFQAVYGFARLVDDIGDEAPGDRLALLDRLAEDLERIWTGEGPTLPMHQRLATTVAACDLPAEPFLRIIEANRLDQRVSRYPTFDDLLRYCTLSADPIGRMVLGILGKATPDRVILSDRVCTALQLAEHLQDVVEDHAAGRIYLPQEDMETFGVRESDLAAPTASPALRNLMAFQVARASTILDAGAPLATLLDGRMRLAIAGFIGGGRAALHAVRQAGYDVSGGAPKATRTRLAGAALWVAVRSYAPSMRAGADAAGRLEPLCEQPAPSPNPTRVPRQVATSAPADTSVPVEAVAMPTSEPAAQGADLGNTARVAQPAPAPDDSAPNDPAPSGRGDEGGVA
jgi:squalene synthase HpnC